MWRPRVWQPCKPYVFERNRPQSPILAQLSIKHRIRPSSMDLVSTLSLAGIGTVSTLNVCSFTALRTGVFSSPVGAACGRGRIEVLAANRVCSVSLPSLYSLFLSFVETLYCLTSHLVPTEYVRPRHWSPSRRLCGRKGWGPSTIILSYRQA